MKKILLMALAMIVLITPLGLSGCSEMTAQDIMAKVIEASTGVTSVKIDMDIAIDMEVASNGQTQEMAITESGTGYVNNKDKEMNMDLEVGMDIPVIGKQTQEMELYVTGGWMYIKTAMLGQEQWLKMQFDETMWENQNQFAQQINFLETAVGVSRLDDETINGKNCYVLQVDPDMAVLMQWLQSQSSGADVLENMNTDMFKTTSLKLWIDKESLLPQKENINMVIEMTPESLGVSDTEAEDGEMSMTLSGDVVYTEYNQVMTFELPAAAQDAQEVSQSGF